MIIKKVREKPNGYLVNGHMFVPTAEGNRHYKLVQDWIEDGNSLEPEYTQEELQDLGRHKSKEKVANITVKISDGIEVLGNREAQADLLAIISVLSTGETIPWTKADGTIGYFTKEELSNALDLAVREMLALTTTQPTLN